MELAINNWSSQLVDPILAGAVVVTVASADAARLASVPLGGFYRAAIEEGNPVTKRENVWITGRSGTDLDIVRAREGTTAQAFVAGSRISIRPTAETFRGAMNERILTNGADVLVDSNGDVLTIGYPGE